MERFSGVSSNKPKEAEILTKRDYILTSDWHIEHWITFVILSIFSVIVPFSLWREFKNSRTAKLAAINEVSNKSVKKAKKT